MVVRHLCDVVILFLRHLMIAFHNCQSLVLTFIPIHFHTYTFSYLYIFIPIHFHTYTFSYLYIFIPIHFHTYTFSYLYLAIYLYLYFAYLHIPMTLEDSIKWWLGRIQTKDSCWLTGSKQLCLGHRENLPLLIISLYNVLSKCFSVRSCLIFILK